eukprot:SM000071S21106  [mRNA]  locus=s71:391555:399694:+ [translate_table: standard]
MAAEPSAAAAPPAPEGFTVLAEGRARILQHGNDVFYNKAQIVNRDISVAVLRAFEAQRRREVVAERERKRLARLAQAAAASSAAPKAADGDALPGDCAEGAAPADACAEAPRSETGATAGTSNSETRDGGGAPLRVLEALAASGLRAIRYALEVQGIGSILALDNDRVAVQACKRNIAYNGNQAAAVSVEEADSRVYMLTHEKAFDVVDLDPYGSPSIFLDSAVQSVADGGLLMCTATDMAVLCGNNGEVCHSKYGSFPLKGKFCHEMALRILLASIESHANRYKRHIVPVLSLSVDFYVRVFVRIYTSAATVKATPSKLAYIYQCVGCESYHLQPVGRVLQKHNQVRYTPGVGPPIGQACEHCGKHFYMGGPMWSDPIHDASWQQQIMDGIKAAPGEYPAYDKIHAIMTAVSEELLDVPLYISLHALSSTLKCTPPSAAIFRSAVANAGYRISSSHANPLGLKTDAPMSIIWDIMRCWVKSHPVKKQPEETAGSIILKKEPETMANFVRVNAALSKAQLSGVSRFLPNPEQYWGPKPRAGRAVTARHLASTGLPVTATNGMKQLDHKEDAGRSSKRLRDGTADNEDGSPVPPEDSCREGLHISSQELAADNADWRRRKNDANAAPVGPWPPQAPGGRGPVARWGPGSFSRFAFTFHHQPNDDSNAPLAQTAPATAAMAPAAQQPVRVVVVGAGPSGLLFAHYLLRHGAGRFGVQLFEKGPDLTSPAAERPGYDKRYSMGINLRGQLCLKTIPGLFEKVKENAVLAEHGAAIFIGGKPVTISPDTRKATPSLMVDRDTLCKALLEELLARFTDSELFTIRYESTCTSINLAEQTMSFSATGAQAEGASMEAKDGTVGADGVRSAVRLAFIQQSRNFAVEMRDIFNDWSVVRIPAPEGFPLGTLHVFPKVPRAANSGAMGLPLPTGDMCFLIGWASNDPPMNLLTLKSPEEAKEWFDERIPYLKIGKQAAWSVVTQTKKTTMQVKCGRYHATPGQAVLVGDAAHATSPAIGQGCNSSLVDAVVLARMLTGKDVDETNRVPQAEDPTPAAWEPSEILAALPKVLERYSALQVKEGHAVVDMSWSGAALDKSLQMQQQLISTARSVLYRYLPWALTRPLFDLCGSTLTPYSKIYEMYKSEVDKIGASNNRIREKFLAEQFEACLIRPIFKPEQDLQDAAVVTYTNKAWRLEGFYYFMHLARAWLRGG